MQKVHVPYAQLSLVAAALLAVGYGYLYYLSLNTNKAVAEIASTTAERMSAVEQQSVGLSDALYAVEQSLAAIQSRVGGFESTVNTLEKLSKTDPELLQKYSKVFFLNEHYAPERLSEIDADYIYSDTRIEKTSAPVLPFLEDLLEDAKDDDIELFVKSAYRSFEEQSTLKTEYTVTYGARSANSFSADQGYSEHQLGTTVDFISTGQDGKLPGFDQTDAYEWLVGNAHKYGFVLSYPRDNGYYIYEPWHWRFVGLKLAEDLQEDEKYFYELEQRRIDEYLVNFFDKK